MFNAKHYSNEYNKLNREYFTKLYRYKRYGTGEKPTPKHKPKLGEYKKENKKIILTFN